MKLKPYLVLGATLAVAAGTATGSDASESGSTQARKGNSPDDVRQVQDMLNERAPGPSGAAEPSATLDAVAEHQKAAKSNPRNKTPVPTGKAGSPTDRRPTTPSSQASESKPVYKRKADRPVSVPKKSEVRKSKSPWLE